MSLSFAKSDSYFLVESELVLPYPLETVFAFFADARNLEEITPPFLHFRINTPLPIQMAEGTKIEYALRLHGIPIRWLTLISHWEPPYHFVDQQLRGPYLFWKHTHFFEELPGGTKVIDKVEYSVPGGSLVNRFFVEPDLRKIFHYRTEKLKEWSF